MNVSIVKSDMTIVKPFFSAKLAIEQKYVTSVEGIIDDDVDKCIDNLARIGFSSYAGNR